MDKSKLHQLIDNLFLQQQEEICLKTATEVFGENWKYCPKEQMSEQQFKQWWQETQQRPYKDYYYDVAVFVWNSYSSYITP